MRVIEFNVITEIGVPINKVNKYKTVHGLLNYVEKINCQFIQDVRYIGDFEICNNIYGYGVPFDVKNFRSCENRKNRTHRVFRLFGDLLFVNIPANTKIKDIFGIWRFEYENSLIEIQIAGMKVRHNQDNRGKHIIYRGKVMNKKIRRLKKESC